MDLSRNLGGQVPYSEHGGVYRQLRPPAVLLQLWRKHVRRTALFVAHRLRSNISHYNLCSNHTELLTSVSSPDILLSATDVCLYEVLPCRSLPNTLPCIRARHVCRLWKIRRDHLGARVQLVVEESGHAGRALEYVLQLILHIFFVT